MKRVKIYQFGGLGNQLFHVVLANQLCNDFRVTLDSSYESKLSSKWKIPDVFQTNASSLISKKRNLIKRKNFNLLLRLSNSGKRTKIIEVIKKFSVLLHCIFLFFEEFVIYHSYISTRINDDSDLNLKRNKNYFVIGYFQISKYQEKQPLIIKRDTVEKIINRHNWPRISDTDIALHCRLGDYLHERKFGNLGSDYYEAAIDYLSKKGFHGKIFVFTNNLIGVSNYLPIKYRKRYLFTQVSDPIEALIYFSTSKSFIIANSTFSWWAAEISSNLDKNVVYPWPWFREIPIGKNLIPINWVRINSNFID